ncbi:MAG: LysM peptidoglycan-binding domain-containing protein [Anaerolineae bacterium]|nr:LysM peptidoglycan-binding domain-containing protein [Anaerolineae bacterium]
MSIRQFTSPPAPLSASSEGENTGYLIVGAKHASPFLSVLFALILIVVAGCQMNTPPVPTVVPTASQTLTFTPSATLSVSLTPSATFRPIVTATAPAPVVSGPIAEGPTVAPTQGPYCYTAKAGDTLVSLIARSGYADLSVLAETRRLNEMCSTCNDIQVGQQYCVPRQTATPTPQGYEATLTKRAAEGIGQTKVLAIATFVIPEGANLISIQITTGVSLRELCELNHPDPLNCGGCNIDKPIGEQGCRPSLRAGAVLKIPGPTPTPTITPTLSGSETATPTRSYSAPRLVAPAIGSRMSGAVQLMWLPSGILLPDEVYLVQITDATTDRTWRFDTQATSVRMPPEAQPADGNPHTFNWKVGIARKSAEGALVQIGQESVIFTFIWQ